MLIVDNGPTHALRQLERWLQAEVAADGLSLSIQICWLPKHASWLDQREIWFSILQPKLLQPNRFATSDELEQALLQFIEAYNRAARPIQWMYTVDKLERKRGIHV